jgi:hypothetical protein
MADLDFTKRRLVEQHEEDMEQLMMLKKQLEKKVSENIVLENMELPCILAFLMFLFVLYPFK